MSTDDTVFTTVGFRKGTIDETAPRIPRNILGSNREDSPERRNPDNNNQHSLTRMTGSSNLPIENCSESQQLPRPMTPRQARAFRRVEATAPHVAADSAELTVSVGDIITLRGIPEFGWCEGEINGKVGWFPITVSNSLTAVSATSPVQATVIESQSQSAAVETSSIVENKKKIRDAIQGKILRRPKHHELQHRNILADSGSQKAVKMQQLQQNINSKHRAEVLNSLISKRAGTEISPERIPIGKSLSDQEGAIIDVDDFEENLSAEAKAINLFSTNPNKAVAMLVENGVIESSPDAIANYLYRSNKLNKQMIGDYLGDHAETNRAVLDSFLQKIDFSEDNFEQALRRFLYAFKLPGEAQKIDRIMEAFARKYVSQCNYHKNLFKSKDCIYVLAFSTIMLNTDIHNPSIKKKMAQHEFVNNNRGINEGENLPDVFLEDLYQRIVEEEIKTKDLNSFPYAMKRGYLHMKKPKSLRSKKTVKYWWVLDRESGLHCFKQEIDPVPLKSYKLAQLQLNKKQTPQPTKTGLFPLKLTYDENAKPTVIKLLAGSKRIWVDWLSLFTQLLPDT